MVQRAQSNLFSQQKRKMIMETLEEQLKEKLACKKSLVKRPAKGFIGHDYLVPGGPYEEQWDWDAFFIGMSLASEISSEAIYLKNWALNYLEKVKSDGFTPGLLTPDGVDRRLKHIKPFLAQGCYFASRFLNDFSWLPSHWEKLKKAVEYRESTYFDKEIGLGCWYDSMESGADNNLAVLGYPKGSVFAADLNTFLYREYLALSFMARHLKNEKDAVSYRRKADKMKKTILKYFWSEEDDMFYNRHRKTGDLIKRRTYSGIIPLWAGIAPAAQGKEMIKRYILNPKHLWARYGVRSLSKSDPDYNQANIIKPHSNWQGPVWPLVNYLVMHALLHYGFRREAQRLAEIISELCLEDIKKTGGMHENYNADTGKPLAAPNFISWNLLAGQMISEAKSGNNPFRIP